MKMVVDILKDKNVKSPNLNHEIYKLMRMGCRMKFGPEATLSGVRDLIIGQTKKDPVYGLRLMSGIAKKMMFHNEINEKFTKFHSDLKAYIGHIDSYVSRYIINLLGNDIPNTINILGDTRFLLFDLILNYDEKYLKYDSSDVVNRLSKYKKLSNTMGIVKCHDIYERDFDQKYVDIERCPNLVIPKFIKLEDKCMREYIPGLNPVAQVLWKYVACNIDKLYASISPADSAFVTRYNNAIMYASGMGYRSPNVKDKNLEDKLAIIKDISKVNIYL